MDLLHIEWGKLCCLRHWRCFLRLHVAIDSLMPLMYIITVIIVLLPSQDTP